MQQNAVHLNLHLDFLYIQNLTKLHKLKKLLWSSLAFSAPAFLHIEVAQAFHVCHLERGVDGIDLPNWFPC